MRRYVWWYATGAAALAVLALRPLVAAGRHPVGAAATAVAGHGEVRA